MRTPIDSDSMTSKSIEGVVRIEQNKQIKGGSRGLMREVYLQRKFIFLLVRCLLGLLLLHLDHTQMMKKERVTRVKAPK